MKKILVVGIIVLFIGVTAAPTINAYRDEEFLDSEIVEITTSVYNNMGASSLINIPESSLIYIEAPLNLSMNHTYYHWIKSWSDKPFPRNTLMFIGSCVGFRPRMFVRIFVFSHCPCPSKIDVYSDGEYYDTIYPEFWGPISSRRYPLDYYEKGFHTLTYVVGKDISSSLELDVQVGFNGFLFNIKETY